MNREEFEKLPLVVKFLPYVFWNEETLGYCNNSDNSTPLDFATWLNGAWWMFQEQQKSAGFIV